MLNNQKGAALMQVLLVTAILAGMATLLLRASLARTSSVRQTRQAVSTELLIESCQAQVNMMWSKKTPEAFARDLSGCWMNCKINPADDPWKPGDLYTNSLCNTSSNATPEYKCTVPVQGGNITVKAKFSQPAVDGTSAAEPCQLTYSLDQTDSEKL